ncbi:putative galactose oxidase, central domain superfamily [Helianthus annuus]|nr:putative galactose oxidase, central domain superfamily [Helianthus annuus]
MLTPPPPPRHSTAVLLRDGRFLVGGSNPHEKYVFTNVLYPTQLSLEAFSPSYWIQALLLHALGFYHPRLKPRYVFGLLLHLWYQDL